MTNTLKKNNDDFSGILPLADKATRLGHNIIDTFLFYFIIFLHSLIIDKLTFIPEEGSLWLGFYFFFLYVMFLAIFEYFFGKTPGKFLTKTKVVKRNGSKPTFLNFLGRNTARLIPFDPISYLFLKRGWHDQISGTYVIYDNKLKPTAM